MLTLLKQIRDAALVTTPIFFAVHKYRIVSAQEMQTTNVLGHSSVPDITFIYFSEDGDDCLANPKMDPIGIYGDGMGNRRYLWRDNWYAEYPLNLIPLLQRSDDIGDIVGEMRHPVFTASQMMPQPGIWKALYGVTDAQTANSSQTPGTSDEL